MLHAMSNPVVLYVDAHWDSPFVFTVFVALSEKPVPFVAQPLDLDRGDQRGPEYRRKSLTARVPAIEHDGFTLSESLIFVSIVLLGGIGNLAGVLPATALVVLLPEKLQVIQEYRFLLFSILVILILLYRPAGLLPRRLRAYVPGWGQP